MLTITAGISLRISGETFAIVMKKFGAKTTKQ